MANKRAFVVLNWHKERKEKVEKEIFAKIPCASEDTKAIVFYREKDYLENTPSYSGKIAVEMVPMSEEDGKNRASALNAVYSYCKKNLPGYFVHVLYDSIELNSEKMPLFADEIEKMMDKLKLDIWFNTYTDGCNFVFNKFDGRVSIAINDPKYKQIYDKTIIWTSHSNPNYSILAIDRMEIPENGKVFDDRFQIQMFWIIRFLCERARDKKGFMNHYPTIQEEIGAFRSGKYSGVDPSREEMANEDRMFSELGLDHTPNQDIEVLMDFIVDRLDS